VILFTPAKSEISRHAAGLTDNGRTTRKRDIVGGGININDKFINTLVRIFSKKKSCFKVTSEQPPFLQHWTSLVALYSLLIVAWRSVNWRSVSTNCRTCDNWLSHGTLISADQHVTICQRITVDYCGRSKYYSSVWLQTCLDRDSER